MNKYSFTAIMLAGILAVSVIFTTSYVRLNNKEAADGELTIVTSFYPMYIAAMNIVGDADGVELENLSQPQTGCLHDFQLTPEDMKLLSTADVFIVNGGGIESFMSEVASSYPELEIIEACADIELLEEDGNDEYNAHAWMSVRDYRQMVSTITGQLSAADPSHADLYEENAGVYDSCLETLAQKEEELAQKAAGTKVILFHEAYEYVARDLEMNVVYTMDLDEERQVSAGETADVIAAADQDGASLILAEELYGKDMAQTVQKETDINVVFIDPLTRGEYQADSYLEGMEQNLDLIEAALTN